MRASFGLGKVRLFTYQTKQIEKEILLSHFWGFGGQKIMHATYKFFMREHTVYVSVTNHRELDEDEIDRSHVYYWDITKAFNVQMNYSKICVLSVKSVLSTCHKLPKCYKIANNNLDILTS